MKMGTLVMMATHARRMIHAMFGLREHSQDTALVMLPLETSVTMEMSAPKTILAQTEYVWDLLLKIVLCATITIRVQFLISADLVCVLEYTHLMAHNVTTQTHVLQEIFVCNLSVLVFI